MNREEFIKKKMIEHKVGTPCASDKDLLSLAEMEWNGVHKITVNNEDISISFQEFINSRKEYIKSKYPGLNDFEAFLIAYREWGRSIV